MRNIVGDQVLRLAAAQLQSQASNAWASEIVMSLGLS